MKSIFEQAGLVSALFVFALPAVAHHSRAIFDRERVVTVEGVVTAYEWGNPHIHVLVETETDSGDAVTWDFETGTTTIMRGRGWSPDMLSPGDRVVIEANPVRTNGSTTGDVISIRRSDVTLIDDDIERAAIEAANSSQFRANGISGIWQVNSELMDLFNNSSSWPLTPRAVEAVESYDDRTMNPQNECMARSIPWVMIFPGIQSIEISDRKVFIRTEYDTVERTVHMDIDSHDGAEFAYHGHSIGWWEDDVLVVDTTHFSDHRSGIARGVPSGSRKHLVERFELSPDRTRLVYRFELEDPEYLSAPVVREQASPYRPDLEFEPIECDLENARRFIEH